MRVRRSTETRTGRAIDLSDWNVSADVVGDAVRGDDSDGLAIACPPPGPVHEHVGVIRPRIEFSRRAALAAAARSRGRTAPQDGELARIRERLDALDPAPVGLADARRRVADAEGSEAAVRERVATLQGRVQALRETDGDPSDAEAELADATRRLADLETERIAAEQTLARARERARETRDARRERLRLRDRADNLRRRAREHLADALGPAFERVRGAVPGETPPSVTAALAVARLADLTAPIVIDAEAAGFEAPSAAATWLDAPVIYV
ncbi:DUF7856 family protein [Halorussus marinus]|uniref:DUF7856 family protein n=1 Tax=Halorussus marinus TaxID=2505976 RepID=UPI001091BCFC|nr:hypothetical protein [Halorussus marinus]